LSILDPLRELDQVAYLRFASVYQGFDSLEDFEAAIDSLRADALLQAGQSRQPLPEDFADCTQAEEVVNSSEKSCLRVRRSGNSCVVLTVRATARGRLRFGGEAEPKRPSTFPDRALRTALA